MRRIASSARTPITESCGPVMPASVTAAVPPAVRARHLSARACACRSTAVDAPVEPLRECDLLARGLGMEVDDDDRRLRPALRRRARRPPPTSRHRRVEEERAEQVDHRHPDAVAAPRRPQGRAPASTSPPFAGRIHALARGEVLADARPSIRGFPSVTTSAPAPSSPSASFGVMPAPSATFSPLTMQTPRRSRPRSPASRSSTARRPGAEDVGEEEYSRFRDQRGRRADPDRDVVPRVVGGSARVPAARRARG